MSSSEKFFSDQEILDFTLNQILSYLTSNEVPMVLAVLPSKKVLDELIWLIWDSEEHMKIIDKLYRQCGIVQSENTAIYLTTPDDMGGIEQLDFTKVIDWRK